MSTIWISKNPQELAEKDLEEIHSIAPGMKVLVTDDPQQVEAVLDDIEVAFGWHPMAGIDLGLRGNNLRWYQQSGAGADWLMRFPEVARRDFILTNASGVDAIPIGEHIFAFLLAFARGFPQLIRAQEKKQWRAMENFDQNLFELAGKTMLLIGTGAIGAHTARMAAAFSIRVLGVRRNPEKIVEGIETMYGPGKLIEVLPKADFVVLTVPLTSETQGMIGKAELQAMKPSSYIINTGRGGTIKQQDLIQALQQGWIAGAGLDVFETEPLPPESPLWTMPNVIISAHTSGQTPHYQERIMAIFRDNLRRYIAGEPLMNVVNKKWGY